jgi:hypothetical protein
MLQDVLGSLTAVLAFTLVFFAPGYLVAYGTDLFQFRRMGFAERSVWSIATSFCVVPIVAYLTGRVMGLTGVCWALEGCAVASLWAMWRSRHSQPWAIGERRYTAWIALGWIAFVLLMLVELQAGKRLYFSVVMADQSYRIAFTDAVMRTGIPPANPLYYAGAAAPMRYYYFWYVLCAAVMKLAHVSARQSFIASSIWAGFGLMSCVQLFTTHYFRWGRMQRRIAMGLLLVTGADLVPSLGNAVLQPSLNGDMEWWSVDPIDAWSDSLLWVPHHCASAFCCLLCFLFLWRTREGGSARDRRWAVGLAALAFASAFGLSVYVAFGFALLVVAWLVRLAVRKRLACVALLRRVAASCLLSAVVLGPFLWEIMRTTQRGPGVADASATHIFSISVRRMIDSGLLTGLPVFAAVNRSHPVLLDQGLRLALLLPGLAMELGIYGAVLVWLLLAWRRREPALADETRSTALYLAVCGLLLTMFVSSAVITNNDFGYRAVMLPQFFLGLLAADLLGPWWIPGCQPVLNATPARMRLAKGLLVLGAAGTVYAALLLRAWLPLVARDPHGDFGTLPEDNYQIREAFATLNDVAAQRSVVAFRDIDPVLDRKDEVMTPNEFYQRMLVMDAGRQILNAEGKCAIHFGGDPGPCKAIQSATVELYASPSPSADWARGYCRRFGVQYLVLSHWDPSWNATTGWPTTLKVVAQQPAFKLLQCKAGGR